MAIVKVLNAKDNINRLIKYISNPEKTKNGLLVSGKDCSVNTCYDEMQAVKNMANKLDGYTSFHIIQSFSPDESVSYEKAHEIGLQFAEYFKGYQVLVATHTDKNHIHSHLVINSVSFETEKKLHITNQELRKIKEFSNKLCEENNLQTIPIDSKRKVKDISKNELAVAEKGQSWKFKLMNDIDYCMSISNTKEEYIKNMNNLNYQVVWTDNRKYITYTTPEGQKCRDKSLHDVKYLKEEMENEFGRIEGEKFEKNRKTENGSQTRGEFSIDRKNNDGDSNSNAELYNETRRNNKKEKNSVNERYSTRNFDRYYCNTSLETLRHVAYLIADMEYIGPRRNIKYCSGDLSKQAKKEWTMKHKNSNSFDWFEDDFEM